MLARHLLARRGGHRRVHDAEAARTDAKEGFDGVRQVCFPAAPVNDKLVVVERAGRGGELRRGGGSKQLGDAHSLPYLPDALAACGTAPIRRLRAGDARAIWAEDQPAELVEDGNDRGGKVPEARTCTACTWLVKSTVRVPLVRRGKVHSTRAVRAGVESTYRR